MHQIYPIDDAPGKSRNIGQKEQQLVFPALEATCFEELYLDRVLAEQRLSRSQLAQHGRYSAPLSESWSNMQDANFFTHDIKLRHLSCHFHGPVGRHLDARFPTNGEPALRSWQDKARQSPRLERDRPNRPP